MTFRKPTTKSLFLPLAILLAIVMITALPHPAQPSVQAYQVPAAAADAVVIAGENLQIDDQILNLTAKPVLFLDDSCLDLLDMVRLIPGERRPYIIVTADNQPDFMPADIDYYWSANTKTSSPALVWYDQELMGYMGAEVSSQLDKMIYPRLIGAGNIVNIISDGTSRNGATAAGQISGAEVKPGETFSFYDYVFPAVENGYVYGLTLFSTANGQQWLPDIGGGICRTSTALNFAVQDAQLQVLERHHHTKPVTYASRGEDTAVTRSGGWDYRFKNNTGESIQIKGEQNGKYLEFKIYALKDQQALETEPGVSFAQRLNLPADALSLRLLGGLPILI